ncbi:MAG: efflux RND transporter permease subunit [Oceanococcus sp.]
MIHNLSRWVADNTLRILFFVAVISVLAALSIYNPVTGQWRLNIDASVDRLLPANHPERDFYEKNLRLFGSDDVVVLALGQIEVVSAQGLKIITDLTTELRALPELQQIHSLGTVSNARSEDGFLDVDLFTKMPVKTEKDRQRLRQDLSENPLVNRHLVSADGHLAAFVITAFGDTAALFEDGSFEQRLRQIAARIAPDAEVLITGSPVIKSALTRAVVEQLRFTIPAIFALVAGILLLAFHNIRSVIMPTLTILVALLWTLAVTALSGVSLNLVSSIVPPVVITLGLAACMHVVSEYHVVRREAGNTLESARQTIQNIGLPLILTSGTTAAGFLALLLNPLPAVREFAVISSVGVGFTLLLSLTFLPAMLSRIDCTGLQPEPPGAQLFAWIAKTLAAQSLRWRKPIVYVGVALLIIGLLSAFNIRVGTGYVSGFAADHPVRQDYEAINRQLGGANPFSVVLEGFVPDTFAEPEILKSMESFQAWLNQQPEVGSSQSLIDHVKLINRSFNDGDLQFSRIPESRAEIKQLLLFGGGNALNALVDKRFSTAQIIVRANVEDSAAIKALIDRIEKQLKYLPRRLEATVTGNTVLVTNTVDDIAAGQWLSVGIAALAVYIILSMLFTSWRVGLMALMPNLLPVAVYFGTLGLLDITLNPTTSLIACIVLGVAVDDTIHFLVRFNAEARAKADEKGAVEAALRSVIRPVTFTTIALCSGFLVLCFSDLQNQVQFGALAAFTLAVAWLTDVLFTPALTSGVRIVTLWDVLRLDLGQDPQLSIPLLKDLTGRQARTFALLSDLQEAKSGEQVITEGDDAEDIFVIVDGELQAWVERDGARRDLATMQRGAVMGEVGLFGSKRTANVQALTAARLLKFNGADLEIMRRRYPRIAATIYRNLNLIQAQRLVNTTRMVQ